MESGRSYYTYRFLWDGKYVYIYAPSLIEAKRDFETAYQVDPDSRNVPVTRLEPGSSHKADFNNPFTQQ